MKLEGKRVEYLEENEECAKKKSSLIT